MNYLNILMKWLIICSLLRLFLGCIEEPEEFTYSANIKNNSNNSFEIFGYSNSNVLVVNEIIPPDSKNTCEYSSPDFFGYTCYLDSLVLQFNNGKGYINDLRATATDQYGFTDGRNILTYVGYQLISDYEYEFIITDEDYENAHDLP